MNKNRNSDFLRVHQYWLVNSSPADPSSGYLVRTRGNSAIVASENFGMFKGFKLLDQPAPGFGVET